MASPVLATSPLIKVRRSKLHGLGVFATQHIKKGTRIIEYIGEHVSHAEADRRYESKDENDNHTFLFSVDRKLVIDAGVNGNDARYFNHSCDPNCESVIEDRRVFIEAIRDIEPGEEMTYDYQIGRERSDPPNIDEIYACRCGAKGCRGTMLWPAKRPAPRKKAKKKVAARSKSVASRARRGAVARSSSVRSRGKTRSRTKAKGRGKSRSGSTARRRSRR